MIYFISIHIFPSHCFLFFKGDFENGLRHGEGSLSLPDSTKYIGSWKRGFLSFFFFFFFFFLPFCLFVLFSDLFYFIYFFC